MIPPITDRQIMTVKEVAEYLRIHPTMVYKLIRKSELPGFNIGPFQAR
ncbi:MAG: helix-turn-helix domain-containing protein [Candidatus Binataceae bacterium]